MNTVNINLINFGKPHKNLQNIFYQTKISDRNDKVLLLFSKLIIPLQTVIGKIFAKPLANWFRKMLNSSHLLAVKSTTPFHIDNKLRFNACLM